MDLEGENVMTDKEIIIDGVDVSECENIFSSLLPIGNTKVKCGINQPYECKEFPNCIFKRNKRTEQKLGKIKDYCLKNKVAGWVDIEGIIEIIEGKDNV